ncbi:MAG: ABC transporter permease subunit [Eubacterium sp.]|nr:ABC transporter permease subunit [Eubacterium sp.]
MKKTVKYMVAMAISVGGFLIAAILNGLIPTHPGAALDKTYFWGLSVDGDDAYRAVLLIIGAGYLVAGICDHFREGRAKKYIKRAPFRFACGLALFVWDLLGSKLMMLPQPFFPGPGKIMETFVTEGDFVLENTLYSLRLYAFGFISGVVIGVTIGVLVGWFRGVEYWVSPVMKDAGVIPAVAWMPFALTLLPTPFSAAVFLIMISVVLLVAPLTVAGISNTPRVQFEAAKTLGGKTGYLVFHVAIPHALPQIFTGITTANAYAFTILVMAEMMGQPGGLGYYINASKVWSAYYKVFAAIIVMAVVFSIITRLIEAIQKKALRWQKGTTV